MSESVPTAEQRARNLLERMGVSGAQHFSSGEVIELANLIAKSDAPRRKRRRGSSIDTILTTVSLKLPSVLLERVTAVARARMLSRSDIIRGALLLALANEESKR